MQLDEVANKISELIVGYPVNKTIFCQHIGKIIQKEAEKYEQYLRAEWQRAKEAGLTQFDENKDEDKWFWWTAYSQDRWKDKTVYFTIDECFDVQFYIEGKPKPDPLSYLHSMIWGSVGQVYEGLELLDYQFILLAIIHDAHNWQAGRERIYFNPLESGTLSNRLCQAASCHLGERFNSKDVQETVEIALRAVKENIATCTGQSGTLDKQTAETKQKDKRILVAIFFSLIVIFFSELFVYKIPVIWITNHPNSYGIQGGFICLIPCLIFGLLKPVWRKWCWGTGGIALLVLILSLL